ncbi:hypothetical protein [Legionella resiliens]|uniref:Uncharacterized protein n=1 Tax=Legionella resiliens TaxID=2905958 RepID=A0ABS8X116_9GAMM|nr:MULTISPECIES: hypothetical protein [unclassified Legionella]MCE0721836.1 hypothetical protein [Legionella sp. 9fVS26]MCE3530990.1 hypothetical protein [Legionella sp. 8cVS16]
MARYFFWGISIIATICALINYFLIETHNVLQQVALSGITLVIVIIPYCLARAISEASNYENKEGNIQEDIYQLLNDNYNLQKIKLVHEIVMCKVNFDFNFELVTERIERLENLKNNEIISDEELTKYKRELLDALQKKVDDELKKSNQS